MTAPVPYSQRFEIYEATGGEVELDVPFVVAAAADLVVTRLRASIEAVLHLVGDYTVAGVNTDACRVVLNLPAQAGDMFLVEGLRTPQRISGFGSNGPFRAADVNAEFNNLTRQMQELRRDVDRAIQKSHFANTWDARGRPIVNLASGGTPNSAVTLAQLDAALGGAGPGPGTADTATYPSRSVVLTTHIAESRTYFIAAGYAAPGDGGAALYVRSASEPVHAGKVQSADGAWWEIVVGEETSTAAFGSSGNADSSTAIVAMAALCGYVTFPQGSTLLSSDITIDVPVRFQVGAYITAAAEATVTISSRIESERQHIFRGDGAYSLLGDGDSGEDSKQVPISWFGGFPTHNDGVDAAPAIIAANAALGNLREGVITFDNGSYHINADETIAINRGVCLQGAGTRRTVFRITAEDIDIFTTAGVACKFQDIQFELEGITARTGWFIVCAHEDTEVYRVTSQTGQCVDVRANRCRVDNITANFVSNGGAGSSLVRIGQGSGQRVSNIQALTSAFGPEALVRVGGIGSVSAFEIENVQSILPGTIPVIVDGSAGNIVRGSIDGVVYNGTTGIAPSCVVDFNNSSSFIMSDINLEHVIAAAHAANGIRIVNSGSGTLEDLQIAVSTISGSSGSGIALERSAGTLRDIFIADTVNVAERATPISYSGTMSNVRVSPMVTPNAMPAYCYQLSVPDDGVVAIDLRKSVFTGIVIVSGTNTVFGMFVVRAATSPAITPMLTAGADLETAVTALTGTTGTDAKVTLGVQAGVLYLENRRGSTQNLHLTLLAGV